MSYLRTTGVFTTLLLTANLLSANSASAATVDQSFRSCAAKAMQQRDQSAMKIVVNNRDLSTSELDHDHSSLQRQYRMKLTNSRSGEFLGEVTCKLNRVGEIISAAFDS